MFLLDGSASIEWDDWALMKDWTKKMAKQFYDFDGDTQLGVIQYSTYFRWFEKLIFFLKQKKLHSLRDCVFHVSSNRKHQFFRWPKRFAFKFCVPTFTVPLPGPWTYSRRLSPRWNWTNSGTRYKDSMWVLFGKSYFSICTVCCFESSAVDLFVSQTVAVWASVNYSTFD